MTSHPLVLAATLKSPLLSPNFLRLHRCVLYLQQGGEDARHQGESEQEISHMEYLLLHPYFGEVRSCPHVRSPTAQGL